MITTNREIRLKYLFLKKIGGAWGDEPTEKNSVVCIRASDFETNLMTHKKTDLTKRSFDETEIENKQLVSGDLIIEKSGGGDNQPVGRVVIFDLDEPALCSNFLELLRPNTNYALPKYLAFLFFSLWNSRTVIKSIKQTTGIQNLDLSDYLDNKIQIPEIHIQNAIVTYLDKEVRYINMLITKRSSQLEYLSEKRNAIVTKAVIRGINPNVRMKDSGVDWLDKVPEHWDLKRTKWLFKERNLRSQTGEEELLTVSHITGVTSRSEKDVTMFEAESTEGYKIAFENDLVINTLWAWMGSYGYFTQRWNC